MTRGGGGHAIVIFVLLMIFDLVIEVFWRDP